LTKKMSSCESIGSRYSDAVSRIQARRRMRTQGVSELFVDADNLPSSTPKVSKTSDIVLSTPVSNEEDALQDTESTYQTAPLSKMRFRKHPITFVSSNTTTTDSRLNHLISEHQRIISLITHGVEMLVVSTSLNAPANETGIPDTAVRILMFVTPDLQTLVWQRLTGKEGMKSIPIQDIAALACIEADSLENTFLPPQAPVLRVMVRGQEICHDFVCSDNDTRLNWARGLSLAYGLQTCPVVNVEEGKRRSEMLSRH